MSEIPSIKERLKGELHDLEWRISELDDVSAAIGADMGNSFSNEVKSLKTLLTKVKTIVMESTDEVAETVKDGIEKSIKEIKELYVRTKAKFPS